MTKLSIINSVISILHETKACSKGSIGKLLGDKAELTIAHIIGGKLAQSNQQGFDLIGPALINSLPKKDDYKYEVKLRRSSVVCCNFEKSKIGGFDLGVVIWYDEQNLGIEQAFVIQHDEVAKLLNGERAHVTKKVCQDNGFDITALLTAHW